MKTTEFAAIIGIDLSPNHAGLVELNAAGELAWFDYVTETKSAVGRQRGVYLAGKEKGEDPQQFQLRRLAWWDKHLADVFARRDPTHVGIEGYAFAVKSNSLYQIGEVGGAARLAATRVGARLRLHDPDSVKMFGAHNGHASAWEIVMAVRERWGARFDGCNPPPPKKGDQNTLVEEDLAAAYVVARMCWTELELRAGRLRLSDLHEKEVQVFQRATKHQPVSLLGREWLVAPA
jgi:Holliday junction resolvasome RuvABC endonuclease subunit